MCDDTDMRVRVIKVEKPTGYGSASTDNDDDDSDGHVHPQSEPTTDNDDSDGETCVPRAGPSPRRVQKLKASESPIVIDHDSDDSEGYYDDHGSGRVVPLAAPASRPAGAKLSMPVAKQPVATPASAPRRCVAARKGDGAQCANTSNMADVTIDANGRCNFHADIHKWPAVDRPAGTQPAAASAAGAGKVGASGTSGAAKVKGIETLRCNAIKKDGNPCQNATPLHPIDINGRCEYHFDITRFHPDGEVPAPRPVKISGNVVASQDFSVGSEPVRARTNTLKDYARQYTAKGTREPDHESDVVLDTGIPHTDSDFALSDSSGSDDSEEETKGGSLRAIRVLETQTRARHPTVEHVVGSAGPRKAIQSTWKTKVDDGDGDDADYADMPKLVVADPARALPLKTPPRGAKVKDASYDGMTRQGALDALTPQAAKSSGGAEVAGALDTPKTGKKTVRFVGSAEEERQDAPRSASKPDLKKKDKARTAAAAIETASAVPLSAAAGDDVGDAAREHGQKNGRKKKAPQAALKPWDTVVGVPRGVVSEALWNAFPATPGVALQYKCEACATVFDWDFVHFRCPSRGNGPPLPSDIVHCDHDDIVPDFGVTEYCGPALDGEHHDGDDGKAQEAQPEPGPTGTVGHKGKTNGKRSARATSRKSRRATGDGRA